MGWEVAARPEGEGRAVEVTGPSPRDGSPTSRRYHLRDPGQNAYADLFAAVAEDFGCRPPSSRTPLRPDFTAPLEPLLTAPVSPEILYGYGDPCVLRVDEDGRPVWYLVVTSNDAPNAFPILRSTDLKAWDAVGFAFPEGAKPAWTLDGPEVSDFWAPELHRVGEEFWLCFAARQRDGTLALGVAKAPDAAGPYTAGERPILGEGVIDPHILLDNAGAPILFWKEDANELWPSLLSALLYERPELTHTLFPDLRDQRTGALSGALWPFVSGLGPMERFCAQQVLIEAATWDFAGFRSRLTQALAGDPSGSELLEALRTRVYAQPLAPDGLSLVGERTAVLENDQAWEAHLIEGMWVTEADGRWFLFYSGNDFSTAHYGVGVAVAEHPLGPYRKQPEPILRSTPEWWGPGHPSVAPGPDGRPQLFLHAFPPGRMGYKAFRALMTIPVQLTPEGVTV